MACVKRIQIWSLTIMKTRLSWRWEQSLVMLLLVAVLTLTTVGVAFACPSGSSSTVGGCGFPYQGGECYVPCAIPPNTCQLSFDACCNVTGASCVTPPSNPNCKPSPECWWQKYCDGYLWFSGGALLSKTARRFFRRLLSSVILVQARKSLE